MNSVGLMKSREEETAMLISLLLERSRAFTEPKMILIGGYALRAFLPFMRYSRDCDFAVKDGLDIIKEWAAGVTVDAFERKEDYGYMRWSKVFGIEKKKAKLGIDFMENQVAGRKGEAFVIDEKFLEDSWKTKIKIGESEFEFFVPSYADFFILKVMAARENDIRDIAALVWKNGLPDVKDRLVALKDPAIFTRNLIGKIIPEMENKFFLNSWRGTFVTEEFKEEDKKEVIDSVRSLL